jgi:hypothetical protein
MRLKTGATAVGVLVALALLSGCDLPGLPSSSPGAESGSGDGKQLQLPEETVYLQGQRVSPAPTPGVPLPSATTAKPPRPIPNVVVTRPVASPTCPGWIRMSVMNGLSVEVSGTSAVVTWQGVGTDTREYLVAAIPQALVYGLQPPVGWQSVQPTAGYCGNVSTTVTGLTSGTQYIFWVRAITTDRVYGGTNDTWIARSTAVTTN